MPLTSRLRAGRTLRSQAGAFDLPSIIAGTVVVAILAAGVLTAVFGVIPWSQDERAKQNVMAVRTAEGEVYARDGGFVDAGVLHDRATLSRAPGRLDAKASDNGQCYVAAGKSETTKVYYSTHQGEAPRQMTPSTVTGCLTPKGAQDLIDNIGGWD